MHGLYHVGTKYESENSSMSFFSNFTKTMERFPNWLWLPTCEICQMQKEHFVTRSVCRTCWSILFSPPRPIYLQPGITLRSAALYQGHWRSFLLKAKFQNNRFAQENLQKALCTMIVQQRLPHPVDLVIPIPSSWFRSVVRRGSLTFDGANMVAKKLGVPLLDKIVEKTRWVPSQSKLNCKKMRKANMSNAFVAKRLSLNKHILLFDDVCTTGATLQAAVNALLAYKPASVTCVTFLRSDLEVSRTII